MKTFAALTLAVLLGAAAGSASAQDTHADARANGVGTTNDSVTARIQSTSPRAGDQGQAAVDEHTGSAVQAAGKARANRNDTAATGAGEATKKTHGQAKADENVRRGPSSDATADAADEAASWPGKDVDSSEIT
jgi:hypothetical protein